MGQRIIWNPWHGCKKVSEGCQNCYVYERDKVYGRDSSIICKTTFFDAPMQKNKSKEFVIPDGAKVYVCMSSDFFVEEADDWRTMAWNYIHERTKVDFYIFSKRVARIDSCLPSDWNEGYDNVTLICSIENQAQCNIRLPIFKSITAKHKMIACAPLLERIDLEKGLDNTIESVSVCGENGKNARECNYEWVLDIRQQCENQKVPFHFSKTGTFLRINGKRYFIPFEKQEDQAKKANIDIEYEITDKQC